MRSLSLSFSLSLLACAASELSEDAELQDALSGSSIYQDLGMDLKDLQPDLKALGDAGTREVAISPPQDQRRLDGGSPLPDLWVPQVDVRLDLSISPVPDAAPPPSGDLSCTEMSGCLIGCDGVVACRESCYWSGTLEAQRAYDALNDCIERSNCASPGENCFLVCMTEVDACWGPDPGQLSCAEMYNCFEECEGCEGCDEGECIQGCYEEATRVAQRQYSIIDHCIEESRCFQNDSCESSCAEEYQACGV